MGLPCTLSREALHQRFVSLYRFQFELDFRLPGAWQGNLGRFRGYHKEQDRAFFKGGRSLHIVYELFASLKAQARFDANPNIKIKEWKILWLPDADITRPPAAPKKNIKLKKGKEKEKEVTEEKEDGEAGEKNAFSPLQAFHNIGTRGIFYYKAEHRDGFSVRLSACHCPYCIRGYHANGIDSMPIGCLSNEGYQYLICQRLDEEWKIEKDTLISRVSLNHLGRIKEGNIVAIASSTLLQASSSNIYSSFDIGRIESVNMDDSYNICLYYRQPNSRKYAKPIQTNTSRVQHQKLR